MATSVLIYAEDKTGGLMYGRGIGLHKLIELFENEDFEEPRIIRESDDCDDKALLIASSVRDFTKDEAKELVKKIIESFKPQKLSVKIQIIPALAIGGYEGV